MTSGGNNFNDFAENKLTNFVLNIVIAGKLTTVE